MDLTFTKMHGLGNDFVVLDGVRQSIAFSPAQLRHLGDRHFEVLHLPGHSPGSIGLWERRTGILFSGDALYDGPLLDELFEV